MDPNMLMAASNVLGQAAAAPPAGPALSGSDMFARSGFDNSGWNVAFGGSSIEATRAQSEAGPVDEMFRYALWAGAFLLAWKIIQKSR